MKTLESSDPSLGLWPRLRRKLLAPETRLLLFWPVFELAFMALERLRPEDTQYFVMHCPLDDCIPFWEGAMVPYLFWFLYLGGTVAYTYFREVPAFRRMMTFILLTYGVTVLIYLLFPNCQDLRPAVFPRDNALTRFTAWFYAFDTNTDVCPSLHVVGSRGVLRPAGLPPLPEPRLADRQCAGGYCHLPLYAVPQAAFRMGCAGRGGAERCRLPPGLLPKERIRKRPSAWQRGAFLLPVGI